MLFPPKLFLNLPVWQSCGLAAVGNKFDSLEYGIKELCGSDDATFVICKKTPPNFMLVINYFTKASQILTSLKANKLQTSSIINQIDLLCMNKSLPASVTQTLAHTYTHPTFKYMTWWEFGIAHFVVAHALIK